MADWTPVFQAVISLAAAAIPVLGAVFVPRALAAFERRTGVQITDQERAAVNQALTTAAGLIQTRIDQGSLVVGDITPEHPAIRQAAKQALDRVPDSAAAQGTTIDSAAKIVVARVDTSGYPPL